MCERRQYITFYQGIFVLFLYAAFSFVIWNLNKDNNFETYAHTMVSLGRRNSCTILLQHHLKLHVTDERLNKLMIMCTKDPSFKNNVKFNMPYLKKSLGHFDCPSSAKRLKSPRPFVALASFQGSGTGMTRKLLETVTGIKTGTVLNKGLCPSRGHVFIVKTHYPGGTTKSRDCRKQNTTSFNYVKAIYIIRNPYNAILANYNRLHIKNNTQIPILSTGPYFGETWKQYVLTSVEKWKQLTIYWLRVYKKPVHIFIYENVEDNRMLEVSHLVKYLDFNITFKSLYCTFGKYVERAKRKHAKWLSKLTLFDIYDENMRTRVNNIILSTAREVNITVLNSYLLPVNERH